MVHQIMTKNTSRSAVAPALTAAELGVEQRAYQVQLALANQSIEGIESSLEDNAAYAKYIRGEASIDDLLAEAAQLKNKLLGKPEKSN